MNEHDLNDLENDLKQLRPARPPEELMARMAAARPAPHTSLPAKAPILRPWFSSWRVSWRLWVPASALLVAGFILWQVRSTPPAAPETAASAPLKADSVQIDRKLLASFDAVARLPGGEPIRLRCREWVDAVVLEDKARGLVVEQRAPRLEVIPVRFETY